MTDRIKDLVERLRALSDEHYEMLGDIHIPLLEAASTIEDLRAALEWYASEKAWTFSELEGADGDYGKRARAALSKARGEG